MNRIGLDELLSFLPDDIPDEEITLALLQGLIAAQITIHRANLGMSQKQLADLIGVSQSLISRWENGDENFTLETLVKIASALDIEIQCPFKPEPAPVYEHAEGQIIAFPGSGRWNYANYIPSNSYDELKEM